MDSCRRMAPEFGPATFRRASQRLEDLCALLCVLCVSVVTFLPFLPYLPFLRRGHDLGRIAPDYRADIVSLDDELRVRETWIEGASEASC